MNIAKIELLQFTIGYEFSNKSLLLEAMTHPSCILTGQAKNYERLEFLGDAILNFVMAEILYEKYRNVNEDKLSSLRARLVSCEAICWAAEKINLRNAIILSQGEENNGGRFNDRNVENSMEALLAAIYIDGGLEEVTKIIKNLWFEIIEDSNKLSMDSKTTLQEWAQKNKLSIPTYIVVSQTGSSHAPIFEIRVEIGEFFAAATGANKKTAEKSAALEFLKKYNILDE